ncbi:Retrovirus-related Pol polyprotein from type-1 retrotransposable element R2 [Eumeta japonica]|uniref:Retrovirus-related Pol polyprotein from type-1 retrotransposable element R2 n=1 Tax=Eumeta variegata TaxID=151549 RepID=A0A4C1XIG6_EUMVA|nr:Retrovirus-related Pol polyprotein from type-1 retrotransposable element R2 [Eumeta japonica]
MCEMSLKDIYGNSDVRERRGLKSDIVSRVLKGILQWCGYLRKMNESRLTKQIYKVNVSDGKMGKLHPSIWEALLSQEVALDYIKPIKIIYDNSISRMKLKTPGPPIQIRKGVRQGDPLSPAIFIAVLESIICKLNWEKVGININGCYKLVSNPHRAGRGKNIACSNVCLLPLWYVARLSGNRWTTETTLWAGPSGQRKRGKRNARWADDITKVAGVQWIRAAEE